MPPRAWRRNDRQPLFRPPCARETGPEDDNRTTPTNPKAAQALFPSPCSEQHAPNGVAAKALRAATRSGSARALTPTPSSTRPARTRNLAEKTKTPQPLVLTGPSPSGMTYGNSSGHRDGGERCRDVGAEPPAGVVEPRLGLRAAPQVPAGPGQGAVDVGSRCDDVADLLVSGSSRVG